MDRAAMTSSLLDRFFPKSSTVDDGTPKRWFINTKINESSPVNTVGLSNAISTTKYSLLSWLQSHYLSNLDVLLTHISC